MVEKDEEKDKVEPYCLWMLYEIVEDCVGLLECLGGDSLAFLLQMIKQILLLEVS